MAPHTKEKGLSRNDKLQNKLRLWKKGAKVRLCNKARCNKMWLYKKKLSSKETN